jgi:hypothetical protein
MVIGIHRAALNNMIGNHRPAATTSVALVGVVVVLISVDAAERGVSAFASGRRPPLNSMMDPTTMPLPAATIDASEVFNGPFFVGGRAGRSDEDCPPPFEGGGAASSSLASSSSSSAAAAAAAADGAAAAADDAAAAATPPLLAMASAIAAALARAPKGRGAAAALLAAAISAVAFHGRDAWGPPSLRLLASSFSSWYLARLEASPLPTKCVTGGMIALVGDYGAQRFERSSPPSVPSSSWRPPSPSSSRRSKITRTGGWRWGGGASPSPSSSEPSSEPSSSEPSSEPPPSPSSSEPAFALGAGCTGDRRRRSPRPSDGGPLPARGAYDARRGAARFLECLLVSSPLMHVGYDLFERAVPVASGAGGMRRSLAALSHVAADSVFLDGIFVFTGIVATGLLEGHPLRDRVLPNLRRVYLPALRASVATSAALAPLQFLSFRFLPIQLRVLSVNAVDLVWTAVVSYVSHGGGGGGATADD